ncbi:MAG TPA: acetylornithine/succinylornithine family transaminase [Solirubrobacteraceae bacterium]|jgi:predicted acetylornithine/succinylornithine family transaminase|nr:acetylornithine/succinylornithine family transaminase [Solirubrobacteraceae bacterium]
MSAAELQALEREHAQATYARLPVQFVRGEGVYLYDDEGHEYLDMLCGVGVTSIGHCHPAVVQAVREQCGRLMHTSNLFYTEPALRLAARLASGSIGGKVFLCNSGAEANEAAIKLVRKAKPGGDLVVLHRGFHGRTYGALSATAQEAKQAPFAPLVPGFRVVAAEPDALRAAVDNGTAAVLLEPIQGETGVHVLDDELLRAAREACDEHRAALVFDEVQCGLGRTGTLWAFEHSGVRPDVLTSAKALGGGLPIGAMVAAGPYAGVLAPGDHGSTFAGGPVVCAAALAALDVLEDPSLLARVGELGGRLQAGLAELHGVRAVRGRGLMIAADVEADAGAVVLAALQQQRLVINATGPCTIRLLPPLTLRAEHVDEVLARLRALLSAG